MWSYYELPTTGVSNVLSIFNSRKSSILNLLICIPTYKPLITKRVSGRYALLSVRLTAYKSDC